MISRILSSIDGISAYPMISLAIFIPFFIIAAIWVFKLDKQYIQHMSELPLEHSSDEKKEER
jgi:hypothetical protein